jgi:hypothetical protein
MSVRLNLRCLMACCPYLPEGSVGQRNTASLALNFSKSVVTGRKESSKFGGYENRKIEGLGKGILIEPKASGEHVKRYLEVSKTSSDIVMFPRLYATLNTTSYHEPPVRSQSTLTKSRIQVIHMRDVHSAPQRFDPNTH